MKNQGARAFISRSQNYSSMKKIKKVLYYLQHVDGVWSVPLGFFLFFFCGYALSVIFGYTTGFYDPAFIQPLFLAATIVIGATNVAVGGLWFTFRGLYRYLYGQKRENGDRVNYSKIDWTKLSVWQRFIISFSVFFFFLFAVVVIYLALI